jgi:rhodanese-related sulfurtransferase
MTTTVDGLLERARIGMRRLDPYETQAAVAAGALLIDPHRRRRAGQGDLPGAIVIDRTVLEWRLDPASPHRIPEATGHDRQIVVVCRQGYSSSLAAAGSVTRRQCPRRPRCSARSPTPAG